EEEGFLTELSWDWGNDRPADPPPAGSPLLDRARAQLEAYFAGRRDGFDLPLAPRGTGFQRKVWERMRRIPYGATWSYAELARDVGSVARAVGQACGANPIPIIIPCHRVLAENGGLGGFSGAGGTESKSFLLELEGALPLRLL
ncbi:methylated-DNA--[protein]-cysteine S-methyltransferase, partial [Hypericibacter adhaerens]